MWVPLMPSERFHGTLTEKFNRSVEMPRMLSIRKALLTNGLYMSPPRAGCGWQSTTAHGAFSWRATRAEGAPSPNSSSRTGRSRAGSWLATRKDAPGAADMSIADMDEGGAEDGLRPGAPRLFAE